MDPPTEQGVRKQVGLRQRGAGAPGRHRQRQAGRGRSRRVVVAVLGGVVVLTAVAASAPPIPGRVVVVGPEEPSRKPMVPQPTYANTGVPEGVTLTRHDGDIVVTEPGTVLEHLDVHGFITVEAPDVTIRRSVVRGGVATYNRGVITNYGNDGLLVEEVDIVPSTATVFQDGVKGSNFTLDRVYITGNVDSVKIHDGGDVLITRSLLENTSAFPSDPNQGGRHTHNDGVQILDGHDIEIVHNTIRGQQNFAVLAAANRGSTEVEIRGNWLDGGHCTVKVEEMNGHDVAAAVIRNRFGPDRAVEGCALLATYGSEVVATGNVTEPGGRPVHVWWDDQ